MSPHRIFIGFDHRQPVSYTVLHHSIVARATSAPVTVAPLVLESLPCDRQGLTPFTFSRFLVPWLCHYEGFALFLDADMLVMDDIAKLFALADESKAVQVVKVRERFEWPSLMLFNCARCRNLTPEFVSNVEGLHTLRFLSDDQIGELPPEWNHTVGYDEPNPRAKLVHFTQGVPMFPETRGCEFTDEWDQELRRANSTLSWASLMGNSVHATVMNGKVTSKLKAAMEVANRC